MGFVPKFNLIAHQYLKSNYQAHRISVIAMVQLRYWITERDIADNT
jgi:hypothetical protein